MATDISTLFVLVFTCCFLTSFTESSTGSSLKGVSSCGVDQVQGQALASLQVLKVVEGNVQPCDICTRREYARWLVSASSALSRNGIISKVRPALYIENVTELAFDDITFEDPDFSSIQGLAEAGVVASKLSRHEMNPSNQDESFFNFFPESPLSRQDLVSWKMSLEKRLLPVADRMILQQCSGFIDIDKINPDAWSALIADLSAGEQGIVALAFGYTKLFQPNKPVTKAQAAIALATGEASDIVSKELARIEADSILEKAVAAHKDINSNFDKMAQDAKQELERLKAEGEKENMKLVEDLAIVDSEMEVSSGLRHELEKQLQSIMSNKVESLNKLLTELEKENQEFAQLQHELEVQHKALSKARSWAEDEIKRAREQAKVLRHQWESEGIKVGVEKDVGEEEKGWSSMEGTNLVDQLKALAAYVSGKSRETSDTMMKNQKVLSLTSQVKQLTNDAVSKVSSLIQDLAKRVIDK